MNNEDIPLITICICSFKRPEYLKNLLLSLEKLHSGNLFTYSVLIVDNDFSESARPVFDQAVGRGNLNISYFVEPEQNIAKARNTCVTKAKGQFLAFIDDDEIPHEDWLVNGFEYLSICGADGILGPVIPRHETQPPQWIVKGNFYNRKRLETGTELLWHQCRTGNVLIDAPLFKEKGVLFREEYGRGGEDRDLFKRLIEKQCRFLWCDEAFVYERIPPSRYSIKFMIKRALIRGSVPKFSKRDYAKSFIALPFYTLLLPLLLFGGKHLFVIFLIRIFDHAGRILALLNLSLVKDKYLGG